MGSATVVKFEEVGLQLSSMRTLLSDVSFSIDAGQLFFLLGNAAIREILVSLLVLEKQPTSGTITFFDHNALTISTPRLQGIKRRIGVISSRLPLLNSLSAYDNIALPLRISGIAEDEIAAPVRELLEWVGMADKSHFLPPALSISEQDRVAAARAIIHRPGLIVVDDPKWDAEPEMAERMIHLLDAIRRLGTAVVLSTSDIHLIKNVSDAKILRIASIGGGAHTLGT